MQHVASSNSILELANPRSCVAVAERVGVPVPRFSKKNVSPCCAVEASGRVVRYVAGSRVPGLCEVECGDLGRCEVEILDVGFNVGFGAFVAGGAASALHENQLPHCFGSGCLLRESGDWIANGKAVEQTGEGYETFRDGDVVSIALGSAGGAPFMAVKRVRALKDGTVAVADLGTMAQPGAEDGVAGLRPFVFLRGLESAALRLRPAREPWRFGRPADEDYPEQFALAAAEVDRAATAAVGFQFPGELLEAVLAFNEWCDFFHHE